MVAGLEQGLRETPYLLAVLADHDRRYAVGVFRRIVESCLDGFFEREIETLKKVTSRARIATRREWDVVRHRVDEIEGNASYVSELALLYSMLDAYESDSQ